MIDQRLVNVEIAPPSQLMGCLPRRDRCGDVAPIYEEVGPLIPADRWEELAAAMEAADRLIGYTLDQGREGSCVGNASSMAFDRAQALQIGTDRVIRSSAMSLYKRIGRSATSGAMVGDALEELRTQGILPLNTPANKQAFAHTHPATGFSVALQAGWEETGAEFRVQEYLDIATREGFISALLSNYPVVYGRSGHCICGVRPVLERGVWYVRYKNSWGTWGDNGHGYDTLDFLARQNVYGWFAIRTVTVR